MKIKQVKPYDLQDEMESLNPRYKKTVEVIQYCCKEMEEEMEWYEYWDIHEGELHCGDLECGFGGKFCSHCGERIEIT